MDNPTAVDNGTVTAKDVSTPKEDGNQPENNVRQDAKPDTPEDEEKLAPFDKHPKFQKMNRTIKQQKEMIEKQSNSLKEVTELLKQVAATQKGEEYKPEDTPEEELEYNSDEILQNEIDEIIDSNDDINEDTVKAVQEIAKKYTFKVGGKEAYIPASVALQIFKDYGVPKKTPTGGDDTPKPTPNTKPSNTAKEGKVSMKFDKSLPLNQVIAKAMQIAESRVNQ